MTNDMGRVLVTGATGFIGLEVARRLCGHDLVPRLLVRRPLRGALLASLGAELMQGDLQSPESLTRAVQGIDTVIHLGARAIFEEYSLVRPTIVDGSVALMRACVATGVRRFVYASSLLVYQGQEAAVDQQTPAFTRHGYGRAKIEAERALTHIADETGIELAILRLPHVYGVRDLMFAQVRRGRVFFPGSGRNPFAHMHVDDAARLLIAAAETGWTGISPVADDLPVNWNDFFAEIKKYYPRFRSIGTPELLALMGTSMVTPIRRQSLPVALHTRRRQRLEREPDGQEGAGVGRSRDDAEVPVGVPRDPRGDRRLHGVPLGTSRSRSSGVVGEGSARRSRATRVSHGRAVGT